MTRDAKKSRISKLLRVWTEGTHTLCGLFDDGQAFRWDAAPDLEAFAVADMTKPLLRPKYFSQAKTDGTRIVWPNGFDLEAADLREFGGAMTAREIALADLAFDRKKALSTLDALQMPIALHLILVFAFPGARERRGWLRELNAWRRELVRKNKGRRGRRNYSRDTLVTGIWEEPLGEGPDRQLRIREILEEKELRVPNFENRLPKFKKLVRQFIRAVEEETEFKPD